MEVKPVAEDEAVAGGVVEAMREKCRLKEPPAGSDGSSPVTETT